MDAFNLKMFTNVSGDDWRSYINNELKSITWQDLVWDIHEKVKLEPGYHYDDDVKNHFLPNTLNGNWSIGEQFNTENTSALEINTALLTALQFGLESPMLCLSNKMELQDIKMLINEVYTDYIDLHWVTVNPKPIADIIRLVGKQSTGDQMVQGAFLFPLSASENLADLVFELDELISEGELGPHRLIHIQPHLVEGSNSIEYAAHVLAATNAAIEYLNDSHYPIDKIAKLLHVSIECGHSLLYEIAVLRALRLCLNNLIRNYDSTYSGTVFIDVKTHESSYQDDANYNRIAGALMTWAIAMGGADRITTIPGNKGESAFDRRIARNIHHLLRMESFLGKVSDPLSGCYYIEQATTQVAEAIWSRFKQVNKEGFYFDGKPLNGS